MKPAAKKAPGQKAPAPRPDIELNDHLFVDHGGQACSGRVRSHGRDGVTVEIDGRHHQVGWDKVLGHKKRAPLRYSVLEHGEDGMLVEDAQGKRRFVGVPNDSKEDPMVVKSMGARPVMLFLKAMPPGKPPGPGLTKKQLTDKNGVQTTRMVRAGEDPKRQRQPAAPDQAGGQQRPKAVEGDAVQFAAGDFKGTGTVVGQPGADGAHVKDASGRVHQVRWDEVTGPAEGAPTAPAAGKPGATPDPAAAKPAAAPAGDGGLFTAEELAALPAKVNQPVKTWEDLVTKGTEGLAQFQAQLGKIAQIMGLVSGKRPDDLTPEDWANDKGYVFTAPLKGEKRAREKVEADYDGDWSQLRDIVRATITLPSMAGVKDAVAQLKAAGIDLAQQPKDRFAKPTAEGYRDLMAIVKLPNGMLAELQVHVKGMTLAKEEGHEHYNVTRSLAGKYGEPAPTDKWSEEDHTKFYGALKAQKDIYGAAWNKAQGGASNGGDAATPAAGTPMQKALASSKMIILFGGL